jgi:hypothetical protein
MALATVAIAGLVFAGVGHFAVGVYLDGTDGRTAVECVRQGMDLLIASIWSAAGSSFLANWLVTRQPRL